MKTWTRPELKRMDVAAVILTVHCDTTITKYECDKHGHTAKCISTEICCWES